MTMVVNSRNSYYDVFIGRVWGTDKHFGNPFTHLSLEKTQAKVWVLTREASISNFEKWLKGQIFSGLEPERRRWILEELPRLKGKVLGCFCRPPEGFKGRLLCHGQILAGLVDEVPPENIN